MNAQTKIEAAPFKLRATLKKPVTCFAVRLEALLRVRPFVSSEEIRYYLNGVFVQPHEKGGAVCTATDGHRLGVRHDPTGRVFEQQIVKLPKAIRAPSASQSRMWAVLTRTGDSYGHLSLVPALLDREHDTPENAIARIGEAELRFGDAIIDGDFPDYTRVIPSEGADDKVVGFNGKLVASFGDHLTIRGEGASSPHLIFDNNDPDFLGVLMPMRSNTDRRQDWAKALPGKAKA